MWPTELLRDDRTARRDLLVSIACGLISSTLFALWTILLAQTLAGAFIDGRSLDDLRAPFLFMVLLIAVRGVLLRIRGSLARRASSDIRSRLRARLLGLALRRSSGSDHLSSAEQSALIGDGVDCLDAHLTEFLPARIGAVLLPVIIFGLIALLDPWSTLVLALAGPLLIALLAVIGRRTRDLAAARFAELSWLGALYADLLGGLATLKVFGREQDASDTVAETSTHFGDSTMQVLRAAFQNSLVVEWAATASTALVAVEVSFRLVDHSLPFSTALAVLMLTPEFFSPLRTLAAQYHAGQTGAAGIAAITAYIDQDGSDDVDAERGADSVAGPPVDRGPVDPGADPNRPAAPMIEFDSVRFTHGDRDAPAITDCSFSIGRGETVALVGPSGCGKTTATLLLMGFGQVDGGVIRVDGLPLPPDEGALDRWRSQIAWVPQNPTLFSGSIAENIRLGRRDATAEQVEAAARTACIHGFITDLAEGYDTLVGAGGARLSGGQRQRIALARALLLDAPVMILDEFTAHLDPPTEAEVLRAIAPVLRGRTVVLISHRQETLALADRSLTLQVIDVEPGHR